MVPLRLNFYRYREQVWQAILQRKKAALGAKWDPLTAAWLGYALMQDGVDQNPHLLELIQALERWAQEHTQGMTRYLGALCFLCYLLLQRGQAMPEIALEALERIRILDPDTKFSPLRAPEQMFLIALLAGRLDDTWQETKDFLRAIVQSQSIGPLQRRIMFSASGKELGLSHILDIPASTMPDAGDVIALVWWQERYGDEDERNKYWKTFDNIADDLSLNENTAVSEARVLRIVSPWEIAMLYEALTKETIHPEPSLLFELYPLHPRIKAITRSLIHKGEYVSAVFEATKALNDFLRESTGSQESETSLVRAAFGDPASKEIRDPTIKFNPLDPASPDYKSQQNEQRGLGYFGFGVFFAFRHPKGHEPQDTQWGDLTAYEALDQLTAISYLMKRVDEARKL
jgi:uncharacterized protein (TIGR02391 family)